MHSTSNNKNDLHSSIIIRELHMTEKDKKTHYFNRRRQVVTKIPYLLKQSLT